MTTINDPSPKRFHYAARCLSVTDGDTVVLEIDLGLWVKRTEKLRLHGINTPEVVGVQRPAGLQAKAALIGLIHGMRIVPQAEAPFPDHVGSDAEDPAHVMVQTFKDGLDKYGRLLARIYVQQFAGPVDSEWICVNDEMVRQGYAKVWNGQGEKP
jgi:endonuclease YncB( thermonuclease family)